MDKKVILDVLKKSIHNLLETYRYDNNKIIDDSRITQSLCSAIEAMFLHGEIHAQPIGILSRFGRARQSYEYNFWNFVSEFIPRDLIRVLEHHDLKLTFVGLSRVWLRFALNESTILSYLESMIKDYKRLKRFYNKESLIRDEELMGAFCGLLKSIEHMVFNLDTSLPLLNTWANSDALQISGLQHHASSKTESDFDRNPIFNNTSPNVSIADDQSLPIISCNDEEIVPTNISAIHDLSLKSQAHSFLEYLTDNDNVEYVAKENNECKIKDDEIYLEKCENNEEEMIIRDITEQVILETSTSDVYLENNDSNNDTDISANCVDDYWNKTCVMDQFSENVVFNDKLSDTDCNIINKAITEDDIESKVIQHSFDQLWPQSHFEVLKLTEEIQVANNDEPQESDNGINSLKIEASEANGIESPKETDQSWVFIGDELLARNAELRKLMELFPGVNESSAKSGENSVFGGLCHKCHKSLETNKVFFDYYDGQLYCTSCESKGKSVIPRDVISNWDFIPKSVSETTKKFLSEIMVHPNINLATNPCLFEAVPELSRVRKLRHKLCLLWLQVTSCDIEISTKMRQSMFPREYMLASVQEKDLYSLEDLIILQNGVLEKTLLYVIDKIAVPHVNKCSACRLKALPCDQCLDGNNLIYIHEIENYCECSTQLCRSVIHIRCKKPTTKSFYCRRCIHYLENQQPITLDSYDTADMNDYDD